MDELEKLKEQLKIALDFINRVKIKSNCVQCRIEAEVALEKIGKIK